MISKTLIIGISSGIGSAIGKSLRDDGHDVVGTVRNMNIRDEEKYRGIDLMRLDISEIMHTKEFTQNLKQRIRWDNLIMCPATMEPIGKFEDCDIDEWIKSFEVNFTNQMVLLHGLLRSRNTEESKVIFFAGGWH